MTDPWNLTEREAKVLRTMAGGAYTAKDVARELGMSYRTVETHVSTALRRMGAQNQLHAVLTWDRWNRAKEAE